MSDDLASGLSSTANVVEPAAPAPDSPQTPSAPTSMAEAFEQAGIGVEEAPDQPPEAPEGSAPAKAEPPSADGLEGKEGPIPFKVHKTSLENARAKAREDVLQQD